ncbi:MAG: nucleotide sugar dehydrogenase, partial [Dehalococcoidia bacterium]
MMDRAVGVVGLGYVGLPLAVEFCRAGFRVIGVDTDEARLSMLREGHSYVDDVLSTEVRHFFTSEKLQPTSDFSQLKVAEAISICVPTPLRKTRDPDVSYVVQAAENISGVLKSGQTVILESTVYPGATTDVVAPILEKSGLRAGADFFLAFSPERIDPGNSGHHFRDIPKIVGGINDTSTQRALEIYQSVFETLVPMASCEEAEMAKLLENTFRAVNIGLANEMAVLAHHMGINIWKVIEAAATKPFGFMPFYPGPGWGGHCIPVDPVYLSWRVKMDGQEAGFIDHAVQINNRMSVYVVERVTELLNQQQKSVRGSQLLLLGVAYKQNVADMRESPALPILALLEHKGAQVSYHDPYVPHLKHDGLAWESQPL